MTYQFKTDVIIFLAVIIVGVLVSLLAAGSSPLDLQLHDTYFIIDKVSLMLLIIGPLTFLIFLVRGVGGKFKRNGANLGLIVGLILMAIITYNVARLQQIYLNQVITLDEDGKLSHAQSIVDAKSAITSTWGMFCLCLIGLCLLTARTFEVWKARRPPV